MNAIRHVYDYQYVFHDGGAGAAVADVSQQGLASSEKNRAKLGLGENWLCLTILQ